MVTPISIPKLAVSMQEGTIVSWEVADGDQVAPGQVLYVIETDKVETEMEAPVAGEIRLIGAVGEKYAVGTLIAEIT